MKQSGWLEKVGRTLLRSLWSFALGAHLWRTGVVLMVLGLGLGLSLRAHSAALWSEADIEKFEFFPQTQEIEATARACPPLFFGANAGGDKMIQMIKQELRERTETFRREIQEKEGRTVMVQTVTFNSQLTADSGIFAQMFDLDRNAEKQNRCTIGSATYRVVDANPKQSQAGPTGPVLRVGVRDGYRLLAEQHGAAWFGADINFAEAVGAKLNRRVEFYPLKNADERISLTRAGVVDMSISLITITEDRKKQVSFSNPYFKTGLVMGTFNYPMLEKNPQVIKDLETSEVPVTVYVGKGTTAETWARQNLQGLANVKIQTVNNSSALGKLVEKESPDKPVANGNVFITDEVIANAWSDAYILRINNGQSLLTNTDEYGVAVTQGHQEIVDAVNKVIAEAEISKLYLELVSR